MSDVTDEHREQMIREGTPDPWYGALLRLLDVERARADAAEAELARARRNAVGAYRPEPDVHIATDEQEPEVRP